MQNPIHIYRLDPARWHTLYHDCASTHRTFEAALVAHIIEMGYTHVVLSNVTQRCFSPAFPFEMPQALMAFVDLCHCSDIGVLIDWCPEPAAEDAAYFHMLNPETARDYLVASALYWVAEYHLDGLLINLTHLNSDVAALLRAVNEAVHAVHTNIITAVDCASGADLSSIAKMDLGFTLYTNTHWQDEIVRALSGRNVNLTEISVSPNSILALSTPAQQCEIQEILDRMPGHYDDKYASLRLLLGCQTALLGKKINSMAAAPPLPENTPRRYAQLQHWVQSLNALYRALRPLWQNDGDMRSIQKICCDDPHILVFRRIDTKRHEVIVLCNFSPLLQEQCRIGLPKKGCYLPLLCSDAPAFGGNDVPLHTVRAEPIPMHDLPYSATFTIPPLSILFYGQE